MQICEPIMLFTRDPQPREALEVIRRLAPQAVVEGPDDNWKNATITTGGFLKKRRLSIGQTPPHWQGEEKWNGQIAGIQKYLSEAYEPSPQRDRFINLLPTFGFALGTTMDPDCTNNDERLHIITQVATRIDAVLWTLSATYDAAGRLLVCYDANYRDPEAVWPKFA